MKKMTKRIISIILTLCLTFLATVPVFAADEDEEYLSDLRLIYADDYDEAAEILEDCELEGYHIFDANLNEDTGKTGVYLAYKITTDIEDAITDIAIMQMDGGYNEGNYQEMIAQSLAEYEAMGRNYLTAIEYFNKGIDAGHYLSEIAHRQLNFYNVVTEGINEIPEFEGERLGNIFYEGIDINDLATMFMQGNSYALSNIRSLIAMGVSYNEDGKTYLEKVGDEVKKYTADNSVYQNENYEETAKLIAPVITVFRDMFKELAAYESELNYGDDDITELELKYMEYMLIATVMREVEYLGNKSLYDFCLEYTHDTEKIYELYPLVAAMNEGQLAMARVNHYYDVVRYSMAVESSENVDAKLNEMEEEYSEHPFNVYEGVDRTIYYGTFALTSAAYRADAYTEEGLSAALWNPNSSFAVVMNVVGIAGVALMAAGLGAHLTEWHETQEIFDELATLQNKFFQHSTINIPGGEITSAGLIDDLFTSEGIPYDAVPNNAYLTWNSQKKYEFLEKFIAKNPAALTADQHDQLALIREAWNKAQVEDEAVKSAKELAEFAQDTYSHTVNYIYGIYAVGGLMSLLSAIRLGIGIYNYYHPEYTDIPTAMVDLINTPDGDRYIKYDVVYEAEYNEDGGYSAADLNAFEANRWNAMYYTKSYEAGKPLLADEFVISTNNNTPDEKYAAVHRFGEIVSYNLNKYNFNDDHSIYLSIKQSDNQKKAVADVPEIVGSVFSVGYYFLAGGVGIAAGVGGTIGTIEIIKRRKNKTTTEAEVTE